MSDKFFIGQDVSALNLSPEFEEFTGVRIDLNTKDVDGEPQYIFYGDETGRVLTIVNPWGTESMAQAILESLRGNDPFIYRPYSASDAILNPAAELGDGVTIAGVYSGVCEQTEVFGRRQLSDISAPSEEEIDHEYPYEDKSTRQTTRAIEKVEEQVFEETERALGAEGALSDDVNSRVPQSDYNSQKIANMLELTADTIKLSASCIDLRGYCKISEFESYVATIGYTNITQLEVGGGFGSSFTVDVGTPVMMHGKPCGWHRPKEYKTGTFTAQPYKYQVLDQNGNVMEIVCWSGRETPANIKVNGVGTDAGYYVWADVGEQ